MAKSSDSFFDVRIREVEFKRLGAYIEKEYGIRMPDAKRLMLESRLRKRLRALNMQNFQEYCEYLFSPEGLENEMVHMVDAVTTNKTDFFRESTHFDYLVQKVLPEMILQKGGGVGRTLMVWSAGCSTGEEPYTLAMVLAEFGRHYPGFAFHYEILATDISMKVLEAAQRAVYTEEKAEPVPEELKKRYFLRSKDRSRGLLRVVPELRELVRFRRINFMEGEFGFREPMDIIFCRNVIIYFDRADQERLLKKFYQFLQPGGYLFLGHSETISGLDIPLKSVAPTIYKKEG